MQETSSGEQRRTAYEPDDDDEIDMMQYVLRIWRRKWLVASIAGVCAALALGIGAMSQKTYEASVSLIVTPPKTGAAGEISPAVSVATFRSLVENQTLAAQVVREFKLDAKPLALTGRQFLEGCVTIENVRDTNVVTITVRLPDPALAAKVANRYADLAKELAQRLSQEEAVRARDDIKTQVDLSLSRLQAAEMRLEIFKKTAQVELLRKDVDAALGQRGALLQLLVDIQMEKARLARAEQELSSRNRIGTIKRTIDGDPALMEAARETGGGLKSVLGLETKNEYLNQVYENLDQVIATSQTRLAGLERQRSELIDVRKLDSSQLASLSLLYERETELARLNTEFDLAKQIYVDVATRFEEARLQVVGRSAQLEVADAAVVPDRPIAPRVVRNTAVALVVGLLLSVIGVLFSEAFRAASARAQR
jgi:protein tyrosine kinase modulator